MENVDLDEQKHFSYKGYCGSKACEGGYWYGKILDINPDLVNYEHEEESKLYSEFCSAVDGYIDAVKAREEI